MKRCAAVLLAVMALGLCGCRREAPAPDICAPSVMYEGRIYSSTGKQLPGEVAEEAIVGRIASTVSPAQWPEEEGQANFDGLDDPYAVTSTGFVVLLDQEWTLFELREEG